MRRGPLPPAAQSTTFSDWHTSLVTTRPAVLAVAEAGGVVTSGESTGAPGGAYVAVTVFVIESVMPGVEQNTWADPPAARSMTPAFCMHDDSALSVRVMPVRATSPMLSTVIRQNAVPPTGTVAAPAHGPLPPAEQFTALWDRQTSFVTTRSDTRTVALDGGVAVNCPPVGV
jgi:hypothetical protein